MNLRPFIILCLYILPTVRGFSQSYWENIDLYTSRNGLPNNSILSIHQDTRGFLWLGTYNGLCRYDGNEFISFSDGKKGSPLINSIQSMAQDKAGDIWVATRTGIMAKLEYSTKKWTWEKHLPRGLSVVQCDSFNNVWAGGIYGNIYIIENGVVTEIGRIKTTIKKIIPVSIHTVRITSAEGVFLVDSRTKQITKETLPKGVELIEWIEESHTATYYMLYGNRVVVKPKNGSVVPITITNEFAINVYKNTPSTLKNGNLLLSNGEVLFEINEKGEILNKININEPPAILKGNIMNVVYEDNSGLLWMGTNAGLYKVDRRKIIFKKYTYNNQQKKLEHNYIRALFTYKNEVWIGTREGEIGKLVFDTLTGETISRTWYSSRLAWNNLIDKDYTTNVLLADVNENIWAAGQEGILRLEKGGKEFKQITCTQQGKPISIQVVWGLCLINDNEMLVASARGVVLLNIKTNEVSPIYQNGSVVNIPVWNVFRDVSGTVWAGTNKGLFIVKHKTLVKAPAALHQSLENKNVWSIAEDKEGSMWFGTSETGVYKFTPKTNTVTNYTTQNGLADNITSAIVQDKQGHIWISTVNGLTKLDAKTNKTVTFWEEDGLINNDYNFKAGVATTWGKLFFGTKLGIAAFYPEQVINTNQLKGPVEITGVRIKGETNWQHYHTGTPLQLTYNHNDISLRFSMLEFRKTASHRYMFKLDGFEENWQTASAENPVAVYTNLPPGKYTFLVKASVDGRTWDGQTIEQQLIVVPAIWQTPVFWVVIIGVSLTTIIVLTRRRISNLLAKEREKGRIQKEMAELEMKALRAQMNPHFIFNSIGAIQHYMLKNDTQSANEYLSKFAKLMRLFLESSRNNYTVLQNEINLLTLYITLEKLRFEEKFEYEIIVSPDLQPDAIKIPSMLLQPFVENAINHGLIHKTENGKLKVIFNKIAEKNQLECVIDDNGVGRSKSSQINRLNKNTHVSQGTKIVEERVDTFMVMDDLEIDVRIIDKFESNGEAGGTRVRVVMQIIKNQ